MLSKKRCDGCCYRHTCDGNLEVCCYLISWGCLINEQPKPSFINLQK